MRILAAIEDEMFGNAIVDFLAEHFSNPGTMFRLIHVVEPTIVGDNVLAIYGNGISREILEEQVKNGSTLINSMRDKLHTKVGTASPIEVSVIIGTPHHVILETASEWKADTIVLGSHGRKGLSRFIMGSVSLSVVSHADCAVTIVRLPKAVAESSKGENAGKTGAKLSLS